MIFETHAHYDDEAFTADREELLLSLPQSGVGRIVNIGSSLLSCRNTLALMDRFPHVYCALGVHPSEVEELTDESFVWLERALQHPKCVAVGEIGLDYHYPDPTHDVQKKWFIRQMELAKSAKLPMVVHSREAAKDTMDLLKEYKASEIGGVVHCFSYSTEIAREVLQLGLLIGIGGILTFSNAKKLKEVVQYIPLDSIVVETDCPYLAPSPNRGQRNDSRNLTYVVRALAQIKGMNEQEVEKITWANACRLYRMQES
jgi:TatD DNase family protein